jgi:hypothetical protein
VNAENVPSYDRYPRVVETFTHEHELRDARQQPRRREYAVPRHHLETGSIPSVVQDRNILPDDIEDRLVRAKERMKRMQEVEFTGYRKSEDQAIITGRRKTSNDILNEIDDEGPRQIHRGAE